jgi:hypothetical protein
MTRRVKHISLATLVALGLLGVVATAQANQGIFGTFWNAKDTDDNGLGIGFRSKVQLTQLYSFDTRVGWVRFNDEHMDLFPVEATGMLKLGMLYAGAGVGYYIFNGASLKNKFGWYALGGIDITVRSLGIFGEAKWISLSTEPDPPDAGNVATHFDAGGIGFNLGVMFGMPKNSNPGKHRKPHS